MSNTSSPNKRALVTGATGYIGSNLARHLMSLGWDVHIITRPESNLALLGTEVNSVTNHQHDGTAHNMVQVLAKSKPEIVFHLASLFLANHKTEDIEALVASNLLFSVQLVEAMAETDVKNIVNTGTSWQSFENQAFNPVNLYAATKEAFECILRYYTEARDLKAITLRLFDTYGSGDPRPKLMPLLKSALETGDALGMPPGEQKIDLVHVEDVVECFTLAGERLLNGKVSSPEVYSVSSMSPVSVKELVEAFTDAAGKALNVEWGLKPYRPREVMLPWACGATLPGWSPKISLAEGLKKYLKS